MRMAEYDESKDNTIAIVSLQANETTQFEVRVMSYDEGEKKIQLRRMYLAKSGEWKYNYKLGRFTQEETLTVIKLLEMMKAHFE